MAGEVTISFLEPSAVTVGIPQLSTVVGVEPVVVEGRPGRDGPSGPPGQNADGATDPGDLTLLFDNRLL